ncbi:glycoside hydrolase superfamily [Dipodascopsis tothii]|uniref:glycoside hydrolase superfamily n=1 Tax=Dipodascopsis tothii TaxID=44089 RepID=UPI0034CED9F3
MSSTSLPSDFLWGYATASYQIEGSPEADGRGLSIWDTFSRLEGTTEDGRNGDMATDSYRRWEEDIKMMKDYGVNCYRFSLSWSRIIPLGGRDDPINPAGIAHYRKFILALRANGIEPMVTLFHWDLPQALQDRYRGFLDREIVLDFSRYARVCYESFGDIVDTWITINEPNIYSILGHCIGAHAPGRSSNHKFSPEGDSLVEPYIVGHNLLLAHAAAVHILREEFPKPSAVITIVINYLWAEPWDDSEDSKQAAADFLDAYGAWFAHPVFKGDYPKRLKEIVGDRLPKFTAEEVEYVKDTADYFGLNHYTTNLIKKRTTPIQEGQYMESLFPHIENTFTRPDGTDIAPMAGLSWVRPVAWGFKKLLQHLYTTYGKPIYITENGVICPNERDLPREEGLNDQFRIDYFNGYINAIIELQGEVPVKSYIIWALLDNFEWQEGYTRFGVTWVDFDDDNKRYPKKSAYYIKDFMHKALGVAQ